MNRRVFLIGAVALTGCGAGLGEQTTMPLIQTEITLHRHAGQALVGQPIREWHWGGSALTASTALLRGDLGLPRIVHCRLAIAWTPNDRGHGETAVRLSLGDNGPANIEQVAVFRGTGSAPIVSGEDVAEILNAKVILPRVYKHLMLQFLGNGVASPQVYAAWLEPVWEV